VETTEQSGEDIDERNNVSVKEHYIKLTGVEILGVDGRMILDSQRTRVRAWSEFKCISIVFSGGSRKHGN
jgi:hypothetical protein